MHSKIVASYVDVDKIIQKRHPKKCCSEKTDRKSIDRGNMTGRNFDLVYDACRSQVMVIAVQFC